MKDARAVIVQASTRRAGPQWHSNRRESQDFEITELCRLSPECTLPHRPLFMLKADFLIMEASTQDEELIIGLPELKKMGLDPVS
jgi:hypothetical protein